MIKYLTDQREFLFRRSNIEILQLPLHDSFSHQETYAELCSIKKRGIGAELGKSPLSLLESNYI